MSFPRQDARDALHSLVQKQLIDVRLDASNLDWLADHLMDYFIQRDGGIAHDAALTTVLTGADLSLGGPRPVTQPVERPEPAIQPLEDLLPLYKPGMPGFIEVRNAIQGGKDVRVPARWIWKGVRVPGAFVSFLGKDKQLEPLLYWAQALGANTLVVDAPEDPQGEQVQPFLSLASQYCLRVYWDGVPVIKTQLFPPPLVSPVTDLATGLVTPVLGALVAPRQSLDATNVVAIEPTSVPPGFAPASPSFAYWAGARSVWESSGATLDMPKVPKTEAGQRIAEWFFRGLCAVDPDSQDWQPVTGLLLPVVHDPAWGAVLARRNGQQALVLLIDPPSDRQIQSRAPWRIETVTGPAYSLIGLRS